MSSQPQEIALYVTQSGRCPFESWLETLRDRQARAKVKKRLDRIGLGNLGDFKPVGEGVMEFRIDTGPGYRLYYAKSGQRIILLLCGGSKKTQSQDILKAKHYWQDFQRRHNANS